MSNENSELTDKKNFEKSFYNYLKDAQPLAFMASFSMIVAVFSYSNKEFPSVFDYAGISSAMFLISFISSMIGRITHDRDIIEKANISPFTYIAKYATYFFFVLGVIHLLLILSEFAISIPSITLLSVSWLYVGVSILLVYGLKNTIKKDLKNIKSLQGLSSIFLIILIIFIFTVGVSSIYQGMTQELLIPNFIFNYFWVIISALAFPTIILPIIINKKEKGSFTNTSYKLGTSSSIVITLFFLIIFFVFTSFTDNIIKNNFDKCNEECSKEFKKIGFICDKNQDAKFFICRFVSEKAVTVEIPENTSTSPNEKNFVPSNLDLTIEKNNVVKWINHDNVQHSIVGDNIYSGILNPGETFIQRFENPGVYSFYGDFPWMKGQITVQPLDDSLQSENPITQISNTHENSFKIFREGDHEGNISKIQIYSDYVIINYIPEINSGLKIYKDQQIVGSCEILENSKIKIEYLTLKKIVEQHTSYAMFLSESKIESNTVCPILDSHGASR